MIIKLSVTASSKRIIHSVNSSQQVSLLYIGEVLVYTAHFSIAQCNYYKVKSKLIATIVIGGIFYNKITHWCNYRIRRSQKQQVMECQRSYKELLETDVSIRENTEATKVICSLSSTCWIRLWSVISTMKWSIK